MKKTFKIDDISKNKIIAAYDLYELGPNKLHVLRSYKGKDDYNVYVFSEHFQIGVKMTDDIVYQKFIISSDDNVLTETYLQQEHEAIEENLELSEEERESKFRKARIKINIAIEEFINRNNVYKSYIEAKNNQVKEVKNRLIRRIEQEEDFIDRIRNQYLSFNISQPSDIGGQTQIKIKIAATIIRNENSNHSVFEWKMFKTRENLETLLNNSESIISEDVILRSLYEYILIISYYTQNDSIFENLIGSAQNVANLSDALSCLTNLFDANTSRLSERDLWKPITNTYTVLSEIRTGQRPRILDYSLINNVEHLRKIYELYVLLVESHKKYVRTDIKEIQQNFFGLNIPLGGSKQTKITLGSVLQIEHLVNRINTLTLEQETA